MKPDPFVVKSTDEFIPKKNKSGQIETHGVEVHFGKHKGELWTRIPVSYLKFCINSMDKKSYGYKLAKAELARRGTIDIEMNKLEVSYHAIDRASIHFMERYFDESEKDEGIYSWLYRRANAAVEKVNSKNIAIDNGIKFVFSKGNEFYILKTVIPTHKK